MAASALNPFVVGCLLALVVASGASRIELADSTDPDVEETRPYHINSVWSGHLCRDVCQASVFSRYDLAQPRAATSNQLRCYPTDDKHTCLNIIM